MKIYYLSKGQFNKNYSLDSGKNLEDNRKDLGSGEFNKVLSVLKKELDFKRKSVFYLINGGTTEKRMFSCLELLFTGSKISLKEMPFSDIP